MMTVMAIDPGLTGAFAIIDRDSVIVEPMPNNADGKIDLQELKRLFMHYASSITHCYIEMSTMRPGQSAQSTFSTGRTFGTLEGMLVCLGIKYTPIQSSVWSKAYDHGVTEKVASKRYPLIKKARRGIVAELYPNIDLRRTKNCKNADSGMVDALLLARYGFNAHTAKTTTTY
jgi:hypothetical protein